MDARSSAYYQQHNMFQRSERAQALKIYPSPTFHRITQTCEFLLIAFINF